MHVFAVTYKFETHITASIMYTYNLRFGKYRLRIVHNIICIFITQYYLCTQCLKLVRNNNNVLPRRVPYLSAYRTRIGTNLILKHVYIILPLYTPQKYTTSFDDSAIYVCIICVCSTRICVTL